ncbi:hypothetical protein HS041_04420 [Planomonospora sp. ID67723]|uniref:hypothetical protein n=1 Tax=Planomonospora sp. ID67723 TaxID=2738134 RepID=UPI0018C3C0DF|nr:hypothetical protein [Planomonospora sp. ID67723]MBG0827007.1 hypothetical protein [Planomonospora sp. ID67723]
MLTIRMNEAAASALQPLAAVDPPPTVPALSQELRDKLASGLTCNEGAWIFTEHVGQWVGAPASASAAITKMGWQDLSGYEWNVNAFHLEDYAPVQVTDLDGQPQISRDDQVLLLRLGMVVADSVFDLIRALSEPVPVRCVIGGASDTCVVFRFHQIRSGDEWIDDVLRKPDDPDMMVVIDRHP